MSESAYEAERMLVSLFEKALDRGTELPLDQSGDDGD